MKETYSDKEIQTIWEKVKSPDILELIKNQSEELHDLKHVFNRRLVEIYDEMNRLRKRVAQLEDVHLSEEIVPLEVIPENEAKTRIKEYIDAHPGALTSEIIVELGLDPDLVLQSLNTLQKEKKIQSDDK